MRIGLLLIATMLHAQSYDLVIANERVVDGTGAKPGKALRGPGYNN
jgi:hypothetical protein